MRCLTLTIRVNGHSIFLSMEKKNRFLGVISLTVRHGEKNCWGMKDYWIQLVDGFHCNFFCLYSI